MIHAFIQPRFTGARFAENTLPLDVAKDLAAYEVLIVDLAKRLYLADNPDRQRVPKGFAADFQLHLQKIDPGSACPLLATVLAGALALADDTRWLNEARELVTQCIAAPVSALPSRFPRDLLGAFNQIGRSLQDGEAMELPGANGHLTAVLTPEKRKVLVLAADKVYQRPLTLSGTIIEANWEKSSFQLKQVDGTITIIPMPESFHAEARRLGGCGRHQVTVKGIGTFDSWDKLQKVVGTDSVDVQLNFELAARFEEFRGLGNGWFEGGGVALDRQDLDALTERFLSSYPEKLPLPAVIPTPEGNLLLEWNSSGSPSVDICLGDSTADFHMFQPMGGELAATFQLTTPGEWTQFFDFLNLHIA